MSNYGDDIRRIAKYEQLIKKIQQAQDTADQAKKLAIGANRSIAYLNKDNMTSSANRGAVGATKPNGGNALGSNVADAAVGAASAFNNGRPTDAATNSGTADDLASGDNTGKDGWYDAESLLDDVLDEYGKSPANDAAKQVINTITGLKTASGRQLAVHMRDGAFVGPDGAEDAESGIPDPDWVQGYVWNVSSGYGQLYGYSPRDVGVQLASTLDLNEPTHAPHSFVSYTPISSSNGTLHMDRAVGGPFTYPANRLTCPIVTPEANALCVINAPQMPWTDLGITQLGWVSSIASPLFPLATTARFLPNPLDVSVPTEYIGGASILDVETLGGTPVRIGPTADGGWYMYYRDESNSNLPVGDTNANTVYTYGNNRVPTGFITPSELTKRLPK